MRQRLGFAQNVIATGHDDCDHADVGYVGPAVAIHERGGEHARHVLDVRNQVHHRLHWVEGGLRHLAGEQEGDLGEAYSRANTAFEDLHQHFGGFLPGLEGVVMRCGLVGHQCVEIAHRAADQVCVHVQGDRDRHARANASVQIAEKIVLAVVEPLGAHRAVQRKANAVHIVHCIKDASLEALVRITRHDAAGHGPGGHGWDNLDISVLSQHIDDAAERSAAERLLQRFDPPSGMKVIQGSQERCEGVRLMSECADQDSHSCLTCRRWEVSPSDLMSHVPAWCW